MSIISLVATDQLLSVAMQPTIAAGDKNSVQLNVDFSEEWDGYARSAVFFHTSDTESIYEMVLVHGQCTVPHEVLTESGVLYIGVRGVNSDTLVKTSTLVKYKIKDGAPSGNGTSVEPTPNVYQQLLSAYGKLEIYIDEELDKVKVAGIQKTPLFAKSIEECTDNTLLYVLPDGYIYAYMYFEDRIEYYENLATTFENGALNSQGNVVAQSGATTCTDYIPCEDQAVVRIRGFGALDDCNVIFYNQAQEVVAARQFTTDVTDTISYSYDEESETATITSNSSDIAYLRVSGILTGSTDDVVITVNERIMDTVIPGYRWGSTGHAFVQADYDGRMEGLSKEIDVERKRINKIVSLPEGSTTGDAELQDIRIGADGTVYESAGEAVRAQIKELKNQTPPPVEIDKDEILKEVKGVCLAKNQGTANVGKILVVGTDGNLTLADMPEGGASGDVTGVLDEANNILLSGNLADGTYTLKWLNTDGTYSDAGSLVVNTIEKYTIIYNLTNVTSDNSITSIRTGESFTASLTASSGFNISSIVVTMGGADITSSAVNGSVISIASVAGDVVITAVASELNYTNLATSFSYGRFNSSGAIVTTDSSGQALPSDVVVCDDYITFEQGTVVRIKGFRTLTDYNSVLYTNKTNVVNVAKSNAFSESYASYVYDSTTGIVTLTAINVNVKYIRVGGLLTGTISDVIITINEEIE